MEISFFRWKSNLTKRLEKFIYPDYAVEESYLSNIGGFRGKIFKNGPSQICGRQPLKKFEVIWYHFNFLKDCLPKISLDPCLDTLSHLYFAANAARFLKCV